MDDQQAIVVEQETDGRPVLKLVGEMRPQHAAELQRAALQAVARGRDVVVRCERLQSLDLTSLQILVALREALAAHGKTLQLAELSAAAAATIALAGLREPLGLDCGLAADSPSTQR